MQHYKSYIEQAFGALSNIIVTVGNSEELTAEEGLHRWCKLTRGLHQASKTMYFVGNGASAMMASHMAADASKNGGFKSVAFNDPALMTAVSNDISYEQSFAMPLRRFADSGDVLVTISSSGNSPNVVAAIEAAKEIGLYVVTASGMSPENKSRQLGDLNFYIPADTYGLVEVCHQALMHCWLDVYMEIFQTMEGVANES